MIVYIVQGRDYDTGWVEGVFTDLFLAKELETKLTNELNGVYHGTTYFTEEWPTIGDVTYDQAV